MAVFERHVPGLQIKKEKKSQNCLEIGEGMGGHCMTL